MDEVFQALQATPVAQYLRTARWGYATLNTAHVFGIALLVGAILPLDLRLLGFGAGRKSRDSDRRNAGNEQSGLHGIPPVQTRYPDAG